MKTEHQWALEWPGNYCRRCGIDDAIECALVCRDCVTPDGPEDNRVIFLCAMHKEMAHSGCIQTALILHPRERSPYGTQTLYLLHAARRHAESFAEGFACGAYRHGKCQDYVYPTYTDIRDYLLVNPFDMPYDWACQIALYMSPPDDYMDDTPVHFREFKPIL